MSGFKSLEHIIPRQQELRTQMEKELRSMQRPQRNFMKKLKKPNAKSKMRCSADQLPPWRNTVRNGWKCSLHSEHNRPVISTELKTKAAKRDIPLPDQLAACLKEAKQSATSDYVIANRDGDPLSYTQFKRVWQYIVTRSTKERTYVRYINGQKITKTVTPVLGEKAGHNSKVVYSLDFQVTPHQLRHTYITNLIYASVDPKTVQYLAGHENSKITMDIYAKVKYNKPHQLLPIVNEAFSQNKENPPSLSAG